MPESPARCPVCGLTVASGQAVCPNDGTPIGSVDLVAKDPLLGAQLGDYQVEACIGVGAMGVVYRAVQPMIGKRVAVKVLKAEVARSPAEIQRLLAEARTVNNIGHRGVIDIFGFGQTPDGRQYFLMEHLAGQALDHLIAERAPLPVPEAIAILDELLDALGAIHQAGVIHRDLKPSNIFLVAQRGRPAFVKILDFGLSKEAVVDAASVASLTRTARQTTIAGTPEFMAPELFQGGLLSSRSDLYAVGVTAFEMLTGKLPFPAGSIAECINMHLTTAPPEPSSVHSSVPMELDGWVLELLAKAPDQRPATAELARRDLKRIQKSLAIAQTQVAVRLTTSGYIKAVEVPPLAAPKQHTTEAVLESPPTQRSLPRVLPALLVLLSVAVAGGAVFFAQRKQPEPVVVVAAPPSAPSPPSPPPAQPAPLPVEDDEPEPAAAASSSRPAKAPKKPGTLIIKSKQYSTSFKIDGRELGRQQAGRTFEGIRAGTHHVLIMQNEKKFERTVNVAPGATVVVEVAFP